MEHWVKQTLIAQLSDEGDSVLELCCGKGVDLGKWIRAKAKHFTGIGTNLVCGDQQQLL